MRYWRDWSSDVCSSDLPTAREVMAEVAGLRQILSASASLDGTPASEGRVRVEGRVRARGGQTCVVTLDPIENDRSEERRVGKEGRSRGSPYHYKKNRLD